MSDDNEMFISEDARDRIVKYLRQLATKDRSFDDVVYLLLSTCIVKILASRNNLEDLRPFVTELAEICSQGLGLRIQSLEE